MSGHIPAYPLQWPVGWKRTERRREAPYRASLATARDDLLRELRLLGARNVVISTNVPLRLDGLPLAGGRVQNGDPGVAVYWTQMRNLEAQPRAIACDKWLKVEQNIRAIGLSIAAMRAIERCGTSEILERIFTGFAQLPATAGEEGARPWRDVFDVHSIKVGVNNTYAAAGLVPFESAPAASKLEIVTRIYKEMCFRKHPDRCGSTEELRELNRAMDDAKRELGGKP